MHAPHMSSGGRYPVLRTLAILYLVAALGVLVVGVWQSVNALRQDSPLMTDAFGANTGMSGRILVAVSWLAATFIGVLAMFGVAELIKLFIDIEHNTRVAGMRAVAAGDPALAAAGAARDDGQGEGIPGGSRVGKLLEGEETAEGALLRGH